MQVINHKATYNILLVEPLSIQRAQILWSLVVARATFLAEGCETRAFYGRDLGKCVPWTLINVFKRCIVDTLFAFAFKVWNQKWERIAVAKFTT